MRIKKAELLNRILEISAKNTLLGAVAFFSFLSILFSIFFLVSAPVLSSAIAPYMFFLDTFPLLYLVVILVNFKMKLELSVTEHLRERPYVYFKNSSGQEIVVLQHFVFNGKNLFNMKGRSVQVNYIPETHSVSLIANRIPLKGYEEVAKPIKFQWAVDKSYPGTEILEMIYQYQNSP